MTGFALGLAAAIAFGAAAYLMIIERDGWGWLIFAGVIACAFAADSVKL